MSVKVERLITSGNSNDFEVVPRHNFFCQECVFVGGALADDPWASCSIIVEVSLFSLAFGLGGPVATLVASTQIA